MIQFIRSSIQQIKDGKETDKAVADYLGKSKLTERLDDPSIEQMQALGIGPQTLQALRRLRGTSRRLYPSPSRSRRLQLHR